MAELNVKSPRTAYATRSSEPKPNIAYPDEAVPVAQEQERAETELADLAQTHSVTAVDAAALRASVDAALLAAGASGAERTAAADALTDALVLAGITPTVRPNVTFATER